MNLVLMAALAVRIVCPSGEAGTGTLLESRRVVTAAALVACSDRVLVFASDDAEPVVAIVEGVSRVGVAWLELATPIAGPSLVLASHTTRGATIAARFYGKPWPSSVLRGRVLDRVETRWSPYSEFLTAGPSRVSVLRTSLRVPPGALGAGVLDSRGRLIGVLVGTVGSYGAVASL